MKPGVCIHKKGVTGCRMGYNVLGLARSLTDEERELPTLERPTIHSRFPCRAKNGVSTCADFTLPTQDEIEAHEAMITSFVAKALERLSVARPAILDDIKRRGMAGRTTSGIIDCPVCKIGTLSYRYARLNGHISAKCTTSGCAEWIE